MSEIVGWVSGVIIVALLVGGVFYGCQQSSTRYYDAMNKCTERGGTWVPSNNSTYNGLCLYPRTN